MAGFGFGPTAQTQVRLCPICWLFVVVCCLGVKPYGAEGIQFFPHPVCEALCQNGGSLVSLAFLEHCFMGADDWCCEELEKENARVVGSCECALDVACNLGAFSGPKTFSDCGFHLPAC